MATCPKCGATLERPVKPKRGRPLIKDRGTTLSDKKPWVAEGMSRATWYRRAKEGK